MKLLVPTIIDSNIEITSSVQIVAYNPSERIPEQHLEAEVLVVWGNLNQQLQAAAHDMANLRWVQSLAAGPDSVLIAGFSSRAVITSGRTLHPTFRPLSERFRNKAVHRVVPVAREEF
jgi:phosphoglycerate dehydrogenase-like enzyme